MTGSANGSVPGGAIVTGAASGIGLAVARRLSADGLRVAALDVAGPELRAAYPADASAPVEVVEVDVRDTGALTATIADLAARLAPLRVICACAGIKRTVPLDGMTEAAWDDVLDTNARGSFFAAQAALPELTASRGSIVFIGSPSASADAKDPVYAASKGAVVAMARSLAQALVGSGVRVNVVSPGFTVSGMSAAVADEQVAAAAARNVAGRVNDGDDVAAAVAWLVSDQAATVSGAVLDVGAMAGMPAGFILPQPTSPPAKERLAP
jgi:NAD(P)-dependent dehydrogenase (short-subunit alcohol dehydrogenase family)